MSNTFENVPDLLAAILAELRELRRLIGQSPNDYQGQDVLVDRGEAARRLGLSRETLDKWGMQGKGPQHVKVGRLVRYRVSDLEKYMSENTRKSTSDRGA